MLRRLTAITEVVLTVAILATAALMLAGCSSNDKKPEPAAAPAPEPAAQAQPPAAPPVTLKDIKQDLINAKAQLAATTASLTALKSSTPENAQTNYNTFATEYVKMQAQSDSIHKRADDLRQRSKAYYEAWTKEQPSNPEIRRQAIQQRAAANKTFATITSEMDLARLSFDDYMKNAKDVGSYLKDNVSSARLQAVGDTITKAESQSAEVNKHLDAIIGGVDQMLAAAQ